MGFARFMAGPLGRIIRVVAGLALIAYGLLGMSGSSGAVVAAVGLVPLIAGAFNFCLFAPLFGGPFLGSKVLGQT